MVRRFFVFRVQRHQGAFFTSGKKVAPGFLEREVKPRRDIEDPDHFGLRSFLFLPTFSFLLSNPVIIFIIFDDSSFLSLTFVSRGAAVTYLIQV